MASMPPLLKIKQNKKFKCSYRPHCVTKQNLPRSHHHENWTARQATGALHFSELLTSLHLKPSSQPYIIAKKVNNKWVTFTISL